MNYPGLTRTLKLQLTEVEWHIISDFIIKVDALEWYQTEQACMLLEEAAKTAVNRNYFRCAARVLYYYDHFFIA